MATTEFSLEELLSISLSEANSMNLAPIREVVELDRPVVLFGAGQTGIKIHSLLKKMNINVLCFADDTPSKKDTVLDGISVISAKDASKLYASKNPLWCVCIYHPAHRFTNTRTRLNTEYKVESVSFINFLYVADFLGIENALPHYFFLSPEETLKNKHRYLTLESKLADDVSKAVLFDAINLRLLCDFAGPEITQKDDIPFLKDSFNDNSIIVDCGAYDGDTIEPFIKLSQGKFSQIVAFEPDPKNYQKLNERMSVLPSNIFGRIKCINAAVSDKSGTASFHSEGDMSSNLYEDGETVVEVKALDDVFSDYHANYFVKLDVEGFELEALNGAKKIITDANTILGISVYHKPGDLLECFELLDQKWGCNSRYYLRGFGYDGADLMLFSVPNVK